MTGAWQGGGGGGAGLVRCGVGDGGGVVRAGQVRVGWDGVGLVGLTRSPQHPVEAALPVLFYK